MSGAGPHQRLFVYGTLLQGANHPLGEFLRANAELIGPGSIQAQLYVITEPQSGAETYPGAVPSTDPATRVYGELYALKGNAAELLAVLDDYENCSADWPEPHEFRRAIVPVALSAGRTLRATAYLYCWDVSRARRLPGGRFLDATNAVA